MRMAHARAGLARTCRRLQQQANGYLNERLREQLSQRRCKGIVGSGRTSTKGLRLDELQHLFELHDVKAPQYSARTVFKRVYRDFIADDSIHLLRRTNPKVNQSAVDVLKVSFETSPHMLTDIVGTGHRITLTKLNTSPDFLQDKAPLDVDLVLHDTKESSDGTIKFVFNCSPTSEEGPLLVDTVLIPMISGPSRNKRYTVCVSSQVGCAQNCQFCFTGRMGLLLQLTTAQIVEQLVAVRRFMKERDISGEVANVVFMGTHPHKT